MSFSAYRLFKKKLKRLSHLYDFTMHSYSHVYSDLREKVESGELQWGHSVPSRFGFVQHHSVAGVVGNTKPNQGLYPRTLRSVLLIKTVADFELFLVDMVREILTRSTEPLKQERMIKMSRAQLLSFPSLESLKQHIISQDRRSLTSGGFNEIYKYYRRNFDIDLASAKYPLKMLREAHVRRHLHVHRGGRADLH